MSQYRPSIRVRLATLRLLGLRSVSRVASYRLLLKAGAYRRLLPEGAQLRGPFFEWSTAVEELRVPDRVDALAWQQLGERVLRGELPVYSAQWSNFGFPPAWRRSYATGTELRATGHWSDIELFSLPGGDIKGYWEPARFDGLLLLAQAWITSRREDFRAGIECWLESWSLENPANRGIQWTCGQEASLRLLHLLTVAALLRRWAGVKPGGAFNELVAQHCARIAPTMLYAVGQDNNHGTSEAAALFAGGAFLGRHADKSLQARARGWRDTGRGWLEERVARLVMPDGSFAQHSTNYHRLLLDTCSMAEFFRLEFALPRFSAAFLARCAQAVRWLQSLTDPTTGDAPNLGANDGARVFVLHRLPYRDFRPSIALAAGLLEGRCAYDAPEVHEPLRWLDLDTSRLVAGAPLATDIIWPNGGYARLQRSATWLLLRLPRYRFRPSQSDALHLDVWHASRNVLRDGGSYSYNTEARWLEYFSGVATHNTVQFDDRNQMPRLSRFLFGAWLSADMVEFDAAAGSVAASYTDYRGARHTRSVHVDAKGNCRVSDTVSGFKQRAVLRWRLPPTERGALSGYTWRGANMQLRLHSSIGFSRLDLIEGWEARYYGAMSSLPVLEAEVTAAATITTEIFFAA